MYFVKKSKSVKPGMRMIPCASGDMVAEMMTTLKEEEGHGEKEGGSDEIRWLVGTQEQKCTIIMVRPQRR